MKVTIYKSIAFAVVLAISVFAGQAQELQNQYQNIRMERSADGKMFSLHMSIKPSKMIRSQEIIYVFPALVSKDSVYRTELKPIAIAGNKRFRVLKRHKRLGNESSLTRLPQVEPVKVSDIHKTGDIIISQHIPFERWMAQSHLKVREEIFGCANCRKIELSSTVDKANIPLFSSQDYKYSYIEPAAVTVKRYEESFESKVNFVVARYDLQTNFENNAHELSRLDNFVIEALKMKGTTLDQVFVTGYASPEGDFNSNRILSERRANTLAVYVKSKHPGVKKAPAFRVNSEGEDWAGLRKAVVESDIDYASEVVAIIDKYKTDKEREADIKKLDNGRVYIQLLKDFYPALRRTTFRMGYAVRPYTVEEIPEIFDTKPGLLSQNEMYRLAKLNLSKGKDVLSIYEAAYKQFPSDVIAALNYANALLQYKQDAAKALNVLQPHKADVRALLPMAIAYHIQGDEIQAEKILKTAAEKGNKDAKRILKM